MSPCEFPVEGYNKGYRFKMLGSERQTERFGGPGQELKNEPRGPRRSALVDEAFVLKKTAIPLH